MRRLGSIAAAALVFSGVFAAACTIVNGLTVPADAGPETGAPDTGPVDPCTERGLRPLRESDAGGDEEIVVALSAINLHLDAETPPSFSLNLDRACTCLGGDPKAGRTCTRKIGKDVCDGDAGADNSAHSLFHKIDATLRALGTPFDVAGRLNELVTKGQTGMLLRIQGYNGTPDDPEVTVDSFLSDGIYEPLDDGGFERRIPAFDETDRWTYITQKRGIGGYVSGGVLVVKVDSLVRLLDGPELEVGDGWVQAVIKTDARGKHTLDGVIAGRLIASDVPTSFGWSMNPDGGVPVCEQPEYMAVAQKLICEAADLNRNPDRDNSGQGECDAISMAMTFTAVPASLGAQVTLPPIPPRCADAGYTCP